MKDLFIDNNIASRFTNPLDPEYKKLIKWLQKKDNLNPHKNAYLVVSKKLLIEYNSSCGGASTSTCIPTLVDQLQREEPKRLIIVPNHAINEFKRVYFKKKVVRRLRSNLKDRNHIPVVLLSHRKFALSIDDDFVYDLINFPGFVVNAQKRPELLDYES